jgi:hypothetical protein
MSSISEGFTHYANNRCDRLSIAHVRNTGEQGISMVICPVFAMSKNVFAHAHQCMLLFIW